LSLEHGTAENVWFMVKKQFQTNIFSVFYESVYSFGRFNRNRELVPNCWWMFSFHRLLRLYRILPSRVSFICTWNRSESESCAANALNTVACISLPSPSTARAVRPWRMKVLAVVAMSVYSPSPLNV